LLDEDLMLLSDLAGLIDREFSLVARASTDALTSLANRNGLTEVATHVLALCRRMNRPALAIGIDLDHFKSINDNQGHEAGDDALRLFSHLLFDNFRTSDVVARLGGDEFAILTSGMTSDKGAVSLERLRAAFESSTIARKYPGLSWSAGFAEFDPSSDATMADLLRMADARMYEAKSAARGRAHRLATA
jgi:diguanylate cyclase (GGDEF)-like protein